MVQEVNTLCSYWEVPLPHQQPTCSRGSSSSSAVDMFSLGGGSSSSSAAVICIGHTNTVKQDSLRPCFHLRSYVRSSGRLSLHLRYAYGPGCERTMLLRYGPGSERTEVRRVVLRGQISYRRTGVWRWAWMSSPTCPIRLAIDIDPRTDYIIFKSSVTSCRVDEDDVVFERSCRTLFFCVFSLAVRHVTLTHSWTGWSIRWD